MSRPPQHGKTDDTMSVSSFNEYLTDKPFINNNYKPPAAKRSTALPESNRNAVISALKKLQDKIRKLELERASAEDNLRALATETTQYKDMLQKSYQTEGTRQSMVSKQTQALESQLTSAETRCQLLEKQLDYMRRMVQEAEQGRHEAIQKAAREKAEASAVSQRSQREAVSQLERDRHQFTATQSLAENKIKQLEEQLKLERLQRRYLEENTAGMFSDRDVSERSPPAKTKKLKKKKKRENTTKPIRRPRTMSEPSKHFRINLAEIPFVAGQPYQFKPAVEENDLDEGEVNKCDEEGKMSDRLLSTNLSTTPSHSVGANVQKVIALMKSHNLALCSSLPSSSSSSRSATPDSDPDLSELLLQLQDEFGAMSFEHRELMKQLNETDDEPVRRELEVELDDLVSRMEAKSQQITKIRRHQNTLSSKKKKSRPKSAMARLPTQRHGEVKVTTTIRTSGQGSGKIKVSSKPSEARSLSVLKDMKKLQTTLRREDVHWDK